MLINVVKKQTSKGLSPCCLKQLIPIQIYVVYIFKATTTNNKQPGTQLSLSGKRVDAGHWIWSDLSPWC